MMKRVYVAGASAEVDMVAAYAVALRGNGWQTTYDWTIDVLAARQSGEADADLSGFRRQQLARLDIRGVRDADVVWLLVPPPGRSAGAWLELGYAFGIGRPTVVSGEWRRSIFTEMANLRYDTHGEAFAFLKDYEPHPMGSAVRT